MQEQSQYSNQTSAWSEGQLLPLESVTPESIAGFIKVVIPYLKMRGIPESLCDSLYDIPTFFDVLGSFKKKLPSLLEGHKVSKNDSANIIKAVENVVDSDDLMDTLFEIASNITCSTGSLSDLLLRDWGQHQARKKCEIVYNSMLVYLNWQLAMFKTACVIRPKKKLFNFKKRNSISEIYIAISEDNFKFYPTEGAGDWESYFCYVVNFVNAAYLVIDIRGEKDLYDADLQEKTIVFYADAFNSLQEVSCNPNYLMTIDSFSFKQTQALFLLEHSLVESFRNFISLSEQENFWLYYKDLGADECDGFEGYPAVFNVLADVRKSYNELKSHYIEFQAIKNALKSNVESILLVHDLHENEERNFYNVKTAENTRVVCENEELEKLKHLDCLIAFYLVFLKFIEELLAGDSMLALTDVSTDFDVLSFEKQFIKNMKTCAEDFEFYIEDKDVYDLLEMVNDKRARVKESIEVLSALKQTNFNEHKVTLSELVKQKNDLLNLSEVEGELVNGLRANTKQFSLDLAQFDRDVKETNFTIIPVEKEKVKMFVEQAQLEIKHIHNILDQLEILSLLNAILEKVFDENIREVIEFQTTDSLTDRVCAYLDFLNDNTGLIEVKQNLGISILYQALCLINTLSIFESETSSLFEKINLFLKNNNRFISEIHIDEDDINIETAVNILQAFLDNLEKVNLVFEGMCSIQLDIEDSIEKIEGLLVNYNDLSDSSKTLMNKEYQALLEKKNKLEEIIDFDQSILEAEEFVDDKLSHNLCLNEEKAIFHQHLDKVKEKMDSIYKDNFLYSASKNVGLMHRVDEFKSKVSILWRAYDLLINLEAIALEVAQIKCTLLSDEQDDSGYFDDSCLKDLAKEYKARLDRLFDHVNISKNSFDYADQLHEKLQRILYDFKSLYKLNKKLDKLKEDFEQIDFENSIDSRLEDGNEAIFCIDENGNITYEDSGDVYIELSDDEDLDLLKDIAVEQTHNTLFARLYHQQQKLADLWEDIASLTYSDIGDDINELIDEAGLRDEYRSERKYNIGDPKYIKIKESDEFIDVMENHEDSSTYEFSDDDKGIVIKEFVYRLGGLEYIKGHSEYSDSRHKVENSDYIKTVFKYSICNDDPKDYSKGDPDILETPENQSEIETNVEIPHSAYTDAKIKAFEQLLNEYEAEIERRKEEAQAQVNGFYLYLYGDGDEDDGAIGELDNYVIDFYMGGANYEFNQLNSTADTLKPYIEKALEIGSAIKELGDEFFIHDDYDIQEDFLQLKSNIVKVFQNGSQYLLTKINEYQLDETNIEEFSAFKDAANTILENIKTDFELFFFYGLHQGIDADAQSINENCIDPLDRTLAAKFNQIAKCLNELEVDFFKRDLKHNLDFLTSNGDSCESSMHYNMHVLYKNIQASSTMKNLRTCFTGSTFQIIAYPNTHVQRKTPRFFSQGDIYKPIEGVAEQLLAAQTVFNQKLIGLGYEAIIDANQDSLVSDFTVT